MHNSELFSKKEKRIDTLVRNAHVFSTDIGMEFGMKTCIIITMKRGKVIRCEGIKLQIMK